MISYTSVELHALWRNDVTLPRAARKSIFGHRLWQPRLARKRRHGFPSRDGIPCPVTTTQPSAQPRQFTPLPTVVLPGTASRRRSTAAGLGFLNIRSLLHKTDDVLELLRDHSLDVLCLSETWHDADSVCIRRLRSEGYHVVERSRPRLPSTVASLVPNHGGVAVIATAVTQLSAVAIDFLPATFEFVCVRVVLNGFACTILTVYRPGSTSVQLAFFDELSELLDTVITRSEPVYVVGDFNVRLERDDDVNAVRLVDLFSAYGVDVCVTVPTHQLGGMLDVVATRCDLPPFDVNVVDVGLSDHCLLRWSAEASHPTPTVKTVVCRSWRMLDMDNFRTALSSSVLCRPEHWADIDVNVMASLYDTELTGLLDRLIPAREVTRRPRPSDAWFDADCRASKRLTRRLERVAAAAAKRPDVSAAAVAKDAWLAQRRSYRELRIRKREAFWTDMVSSQQSHPRMLWQSIDKLMGRGRTPPSDAITANQFHQFFVDKVKAVRAATADCPPPTHPAASSTVTLTAFQPVSSDDLVTAILQLPDKSCCVDTLPVPQLKLVADLIAPFLAELFNRSMSSATVPEVFKSALITPLLKKPDLDSADPRSYRPISNLSVVSKLLERVISQQLRSYLSTSDLLPRLQSAYRAQHSTETAVLKVLTDILLAVDSGDLSVLALLDLSAAFDTVDHHILFARLRFSFGIDGAALAWLRSYLSGRVETVRCGSTRSTTTTVWYGVPQGSVLGPLLFILYTAGLIDIIESHGLCPHLYADDTQIQGSCRPGSVRQLQTTLSACLDDVADWMQANRLQLNTSKTEILWCSTTRKRDSLPSAAVRVGADLVTPSSTVRDLGIAIDSDVTMRTHVSKTVSACFAVLRQLRSIRRSVSDTVFKSLVVSLVMPRLDYGNATLAGLPVYQHQRLQSVLNAAARLVHRSSRYDHITPILCDLHWLKSPERIDFKIGVLVYRCLHGLAPLYLSDYFERVADTNRRRLRSSSSSLLAVRRTRLSTVGDRAFPVIGSRFWNTLPDFVTSAPSLSVFRSRLKSHLFERSFPADSY